MNILPNKYDMPEVLYDRHKRNCEIAQAHLDELIIEICQTVGVHREKYPSEKDLLLAILNKPEARLNGFWRKCMMYDTSYSLIKKLGIRVSAKYQWLTNIKEHTTH